MKIETFDRPTLKLIRKEIDEALALVTKKYGVAFQGGNIRYDTESFKMRITGTLPNKNGKAEPVEVKDFKSHCFIYGMTPKDLGRYFMTNGVTYKLVGLKPKSHKYPFVGERYDGKRFKFTVDAVSRGLGEE